MGTNKDRHPKSSSVIELNAALNGGCPISSDSTLTSTKSGTVLSRFRDFGEETTFHGIHYVTNPKIHGVRRCMWAIAVTTMTVWLSYNVTVSFIRYFNRPINTVVGVTHVANGMDFPALTLCNYNLIRSSTVDERTEALINAVFGTQGTVQPEDLLNLDFKALMAGLPTNDSELIHFLRQSAHQMKDMLLECIWGGVEVCDFDDFDTVITDWGVCYTFNNPMNKSQIRKVFQPGSQQGIFLRLDVQQNEYTTGENGGAGFKVLLHPQGVRPLVKELGFSIAPGFETLVSVRATRVTNLAQPHSNCRPAEESQTPSDVYTVPVCLEDCKAAYVVNECGCRDYRYPGKQPICNIPNIVGCIPRVEAEFIRDTRDDKCDCSLSCESTTYQPQLSYSFFPSNHVAQRITKAFNISTDYVRSNYVGLRVFFEELSYHRVDEVEAYTSASLQGDIGGSMGLLVGMSIISVLEFIDFLLTICFCKQTKSGFCG